MSHRFANEDLSAWLDGELDADERRELEALLDADPELRAELDALESVRESLRRHGPVDAPPAFLAGVLAKVADEPVPTASWWARWRRVGFVGFRPEAIGVVLAAALVAVVALRPGADRSGEPATATAPPPPPAAAPIDAIDGDGADADGVADAEGGAVTGADEVDVAAQAPRPQQTAVRPNVATGSAGPPSSSYLDRRSSLGGSATPTPVGTDLYQQGLDADVDVSNAVAPPSQWGSEVSEPLGGTPAEVAGAPAPALYGSAYRYRVRAADPDAVEQLLRIAARYDGRVTDAAGRGVMGVPSGNAGGSYRVLLPSAALARFGAALGSLGVLEEFPDERVFASSTVSVQVDIEVSGARTPSPSRAYQPNSMPDPD